MPTLNENLTALVNFLATVNPDNLGPTGRTANTKRAQPQSQDVQNHSRALLLFTALCVEQDNKKLALSKNIDEAFSEMAATPEGKKKLGDALSKMGMVFKNYNGLLYQALGLEKDKIKDQFQQAAAKYITEYNRDLTQQLEQQKQEKLQRQENLSSFVQSRIQNVTQQQLDYLYSDLLALQKNYKEVVEKRSTGFSGKARQATSHFFKSANPDRHGNDIQRMLNQVNIVIDTGKKLGQAKAEKIAAENQLTRQTHQNLPPKTTTERVGPQVSTHTQQIGKDTKFAIGEKADVLKKEVEANQRMGSTVRQRASALLSASAKDRQVTTQQPSPKEIEYQQNLNKTFYATISKLEEAFLRALKVPLNDSKQIDKRLYELQKDKKEHMFLKLTAQTLNNVYAKYDPILTQTPERQDIKKAVTQVMNAQKALAFRTNAP